MEIYTNLKTVKQKNSEIEFTAEIPVETMTHQETQELLRMGQNASAPGFRKGKVPEHMLRERIDPAELVEEAAESALRAAMKQIIVDQKLDVMGIPQLTVKDLEPQKPVSFTLRMAIMPSIELPDYKKISREIFERKDNVIVTDTEIKEATDQIRRIAASTMKPEKTETADAKTPSPSGHLPLEGEEVLPELTDELIQKFGPFKTVAEFQDGLKKEILAEKEQRAKEGKRDQVIAEIVKHAKLEIPELLADQEYERFIEQRDAELERAGFTLAQYLEQTKKTEKDLEKEERAMIDTRVKTGLVFGEIRRDLDVEAGEKEIAANLAFLKRRHPNENPSELRRAAEAFLIQEKIFKILEPEEKKDDTTPESKTEVKESAAE